MLAGCVLSFTYMFMSIVALLAPCHQSSKRRVRFRKTCNPMHAIKKHMFAKYIHVANVEDKCVPKQYNKHKNKVHQRVTEVMSLCSFGPRGEGTPTSAGSPRPPGLNFVELTL